MQYKSGMSDAEKQSERETIKQATRELKEAIYKRARADESPDSDAWIVLLDLIEARMSAAKAATCDSTKEYLSIT